MGITRLRIARLHLRGPQVPGAKRNRHSYGSATSIIDCEDVTDAMYRRNFRDQVKVDDFDPNKDYTPTQLDAFADAFLRKDAREEHPINGENPILFEEHLYNRRRREILVASGTPDELQGLDDERGRHKGDGQKIFNRTHPQGRRVNSLKQRRSNGASFYR